MALEQHGNLRILIVEDEPALRRALVINLRARHYAVEAVETGAAALRSAAANPPDLAIIDLGLPDLDGIEVIEGLRGWSNLPLIVLSARDSQAQKVQALDAGADDYVTKPFGREELLARVHAALRRRPQLVGDPAGRFVDLARSDMWFAKNCEFVLGRDCTPQEKGDLLTWINAQ